MADRTLGGVRRTFPETWRKPTTRGELLLWLGWLALVSLFVVCWQIMTTDTIWAFVADAPAQAADFGSPTVPPRWVYLPAPITPLWDTITIATIRTLPAIVLAVPVAITPALHTHPTA